MRAPISCRFRLDAENRGVQTVPTMPVHAGPALGSVLNRIAPARKQHSVLTLKRHKLVRGRIITFQPALADVVPKPVQG